MSTDGGSFLEKAFFNIAQARMIGQVLKKNPLTTLIEFDPFEFSREEIIDLMASGFSFNRYEVALEEQGVTHGGTIKRHNIKHNVFFV